MTPSPEERAFWAAILAAPAADLPRLVYADYLEENGRAERAEFIRLQCENAVVLDGRFTAGDIVTRTRAANLLTEFGDAWLGGGPVHHQWRGERADYSASINPDRRTDVKLVWHRGFIVRYSGPIDWFAGVRCEECEGAGRTRYYTPDEIEHVEECDDCGGRGYVGANGPKRLLGRHPLAEVDIIDRRPFSDRYWYDAADADGTDPPSDLPPWVYDRLTGGEGFIVDGTRARPHRYYAGVLTSQDRQAAVAVRDLQTALLSLPPEDL